MKNIRPLHRFDASRDQIHGRKFQLHREVEEMVWF